MKFLLSILLITILHVNSTDLIGKYQIEHPLKVDELRLSKNGLFTYYDRGDSCWTWHDIHGDWKKENGVLILLENRKELTFDDDFNITEERYRIVEHSFLIADGMVTAISTDLIQSGTVYRKQ